MQEHLPANTPEKGELLDDNARKFVVDSFDYELLKDNEAVSFNMTADWLETGADNEKKIVRKQFDSGEVQILLISKITKDGKRTSQKDKISEDRYKELLGSSVKHVEKKRHEFEYAQNGTSFSMKFDEFAGDELYVLEVDASHDERGLFDPSAFPAELTEVTGDIQYYGYRVADIL